MFCGECGNKARDGAVFCNACGARVSGSDAVNGMPINPAAHMPPPAVKTKLKTKQKTKSRTKSRTKRQ